MELYLLASLTLLGVASAGSGKYDRTGANLTEVPSDIPSMTQQVILDTNTISTIREGAWDYLSECNTLSLSRNSLAEIGKYSFRGLKNLEHLRLEGNVITRIHHEALCQVPMLARLDLAGNHLHHVYSKLFKCVPGLNYLDASGNFLQTFHMDYNPGLTLDLSGNPLQCDNRLKWLKKGEVDGSLQWAVDGGGTPQTPNCANYPGQDWEDVTLRRSPKVCQAGFGCYPHGCVVEVNTGPPETPALPIHPVGHKPSSPGDQEKVEHDIGDIRSFEYPQCDVGPFCTAFWILLGITLGLILIASVVLFWKWKPVVRKLYRMIGEEQYRTI